MFFHINNDDKPKFYVLIIGIVSMMLNFLQTEYILTPLNLKINELTVDHSLTSMTAINDMQFKMNMYVSMKELLNNSPESTEKYFALNHINSGIKRVYPKKDNSYDDRLYELKFCSNTVKLANILLQLSLSIAAYYAAIEEKKHWLMFSIIVGLIGALPGLMICISGIKL